MLSKREAIVEEQLQNNERDRSVMKKERDRSVMRQLKGEHRNTESIQT